MSIHSSVQFVPPQDSENHQRRVTWVPNSCSVASVRHRGHAGRLALAVLFLVTTAALLWWLMV